MPNCPKCGEPLTEIRYPSNSMLNRDQWESVRAGDYFCTCHNNNRGKEPYAYFWKKELAPASAAPPSEREAAIRDAAKRCHAQCELWARSRHTLGGQEQIDELHKIIDDAWLARAALPQAAPEPKIDDEFVALVEDEIGHGAGAWDMVGAETVCKAVLKVARAAAVPAPGDETFDILVASLQTIADFATGNGDVYEIIAKRARAALAKVELAAVPAPPDNIAEFCKRLATLRPNPQMIPADLDEGHTYRVGFFDCLSAVAKLFGAVERAGATAPPKEGK